LPPIDPQKPRSSLRGFFLPGLSLSAVFVTPSSDHSANASALKTMIDALAFSHGVAFQKALLRSHKFFAALPRARYVVLQIQTKPAVLTDIAFNPNP
jgi:hypothetical protein